jgi:hypothetical protein
MGLRHTEHRAANFLENKSPIDKLLKKKRKLSSYSVKGHAEHRAANFLENKSQIDRYPVKKDKKIVLKYSKRRFRRDRVQSHIRLTASSYCK